MAGSKDVASKADGAMLAIGELADRIGVPTHVLRYWETRFPELTPLQRSGRRRYYRPADVMLAERIYDLLHVRGFTVDGARKALADGAGADQGISVSASVSPPPDLGPVQSPVDRRPAVPVEALLSLRHRLADAIAS